MKKLKIDVVVPVYNEEKDLQKNITKLYQFLKKNFSRYNWQIIIADNASTDKTLNIAHKISQQFPEIKVLHLDQKGRGRALKIAWSQSQSDIVSYMDLDLSSDLSFFPALIEPLASGKADISIGSRLKRKAQVTGRPLLREITSRSYNLIIKIMFLNHFEDAQCGFKALTRQAAQKILPQAQNHQWFFDTEILLIGEKAGYKIAELPIKWQDDPTSTVKVLKTATEDIKGLIRLFFTRPWRKLKL